MEEILDSYLTQLRRKLSSNDICDWSRLSDAEAAVLRAHTLALEMTNGGFEQFFVNPSGDSWRETLQALQLLGAGMLADLFKKAVAAFPGANPSTDQMQRCEQLRAVGPAAYELLEHLTAAYDARSEDDDLYSILELFALRVGR